MSSLSKAIVWSKPNCPQCETAKSILNSNGFQIETRLVGDGQWTKDMLIEAVPNARSVPQIFIGDQYIGGLMELKNKFKG